MNQTLLARNKIVKYIFLVYWIMIFEGAIRKWLLPQFSQIIYFAKDPFVLLVYIAAFKNDFIKKDTFLTIGTVLSFIFLALIIIQTLTSNYNVLTFIFGWRMYFFYLPLAFIIKEVFNVDDICKLTRQTLFISIPLSYLAYIQFISPPTSFINKGYNDFLVFTVVPGVVRTTGTFTFTSGQTMFATSLFAMLIFSWLYRKKYVIMPLPLLSLSSITSIIILLVTGSRTAFVTAGIILAGTFVGLIFTKETALKLKGNIVLIFLVMLILLLSVGPLKDSFDAIGKRFEIAEASEGSPVMRAMANIFAFVPHIMTAPLIGNGLGLTGAGGTTLAIGKATLFLAEDDWSRIIVECGPVLGLLYIIFRIGFSISLTFKCIKSASYDNNLLPIIFLSFIGPTLLTGQMVSVGIYQSYNWLFVGFVMAALKPQILNSVQEIDTNKKLYPNIAEK